MRLRSFSIFSAPIFIVCMMLLSGALPVSAVSVKHPIEPLSKKASPSNISASATNQAQTNLPFPWWWSGNCDTNNYSNSQDNPNHLAAYTLPQGIAQPANYRGVVACGPRPSGDGGPDVLVHFFPGAFGEFEWECVELSMRYMYLAYGIPPYNAPGGKDVVSNYTIYNNNSILQPINNPTTGMEPQPGDILSYVGTKNFPTGHTSVVMSAKYTSPGYGKIKVLEENFSSSGTQTLSVTNWTISSGVSGWLHHTVDLVPQTAPPAAKINISGTAFGANETVTIKFDGTQIGTGITDSSGALSTLITVPTSATPGNHFIQLVGNTSGFSPQTVFYVQTNWPAYGYSTQNSFINPSESTLGTSNVNNLIFGWNGATTRFILASPVVDNSMVFVASSDGYLYAFDIQTHTQIWKSTYLGLNTQASPIVANGVVYICGGDNQFYALSELSGQSLWTQSDDCDIGSIPTVSNGIVYIGSDTVPNGSPGLLAYDITTHAQVWAQPVQGYIQSKPAIANGLIFVHTTSYLYAFNIKTHLQAWVTGVEMGVSSPTVSNGVVYVSIFTTTPTEPDLYAYKADASGQLIWATRVPVSGGVLNPSPIALNGVVYIVGGTEPDASNLYALASSNGAQLWNVPIAESGQWSTPALTNGIIYLATSNDPSVPSQMYAFDIKTHAQLWNWTFSNNAQIEDAPIVADGRVFINSGDQNLYVFCLPAQGGSQGTC